MQKETELLVTVKIQQEKQQSNNHLSVKPCATKHVQYTHLLHPDGDSQIIKVWAQEGFQSTKKRHK
jgi:hypothetical protein